MEEKKRVFITHIYQDRSTHEHSKLKLQTLCGKHKMEAFVLSTSLRFI